MVENLEKLDPVRAKRPYIPLLIELNKKINFDDLMYYYKSHYAPQKFNDFVNAFILFDKIKNDKIMLEESKANQNRFRLDLAEIKKQIILY